MEPLTSSYRGYVYLIGSNRFGWYKIGKSRTASIRVQTIGCLLPFKIKVFCIWKTSDPSALEMGMHERYKNSRINGEWFTFTWPEIQKVIADDTPYPAAVASQDEHGDLYRFSNMKEDVFWDTERHYKKDQTIIAQSMFREFLAKNGMEYNKENAYLSRQHIKRLTSRKKHEKIQPK